MSDLGRKDFSTKAGEALQPDSTKSTAEKVKETFTDGADKVARTAPGESKSSTQNAADHVGRGKDNTVHGGSGESIIDQAKHAVGLGNNPTK